MNFYKALNSLRKSKFQKNQSCCSETDTLRGDSKGVYGYKYWFQNRSDFYFSGRNFLMTLANHLFVPFYSAFYLAIYKAGLFTIT